MPRTTIKKTQTRPSFRDVIAQRLFEALFIITVAIALFMISSLLTFHHSDPGFSHARAAGRIANAGGLVGAYLSDILLMGFGKLAYIFPLLIVLTSGLFIRERNAKTHQPAVFWVRALGYLLLMIGSCGLAYLQFNSGGIVGHAIGLGLAKALNILGASIVLFTLSLIGLTLSTGLSWGSCLETLGRHVLQLTTGVAAWLLEKVQQLKEVRQVKRDRKPPIIRESTVDSAYVPRPEVKHSESSVKTSKPAAIKPSKRAEKERQVPLFSSKGSGGLPSISLLDVPTQTGVQGFSNAKLEDMSREVEQRLMDFAVDARVVAVHPGPVITRFELQLAPGVKAAKITGLARDLARSMSVTSVRVVEVIAGKSVIGIELPNENREIVRLSEVIASDAYDRCQSPLSLALGKDISGQPVVVNLSKMPHLLVAGTTGSGKSVGINAMLVSLLYKATPEQVRLILIDPKMLELSVYDGIPHLLAPVVTDMKEAANALRWCVAEMERRYKLMATLKVRNVAGFNNKVIEAQKNKQPLKDPFWSGKDESGHPDLESLPFIVVVIDEFADMMMVVGKKVEQLIARIAQKARAAGIHLLLATQRPSVDVITGLIKSNIPTRIAFQVSSKIDSRTIIDQQGAEQLLGHGDMLYLPPGSGTPERIHGAFVDDDEVIRVTNACKQMGEPVYIEEIIEGPSDTSGIYIPGDDDGKSAEGESDPLFDEAVYFVTKARKVSISSVQRRLKIGYNRAARLVEEMERSGIVSSAENNGARDVLAPPPVED